jgi:hypothetical protein
MSALSGFFEHLFVTGEARLTSRPEPGDRRELEEVLRSAFNEYRLDVAGPLIEFDADAAVGAAYYTSLACWFAACRDETPEQVKGLQKMPDVRATPQAALSVDLTLRYGVTVHRRAQAQNREDVLPKLLSDTLRRWPLTGVSSDVAESPTGDLTFAGHRGLELLYAERLAENYRLNWMPANGRLRETVEMTFRQRNRPWPPEGHAT